jgi:hypothetical protein
MNHHTTTTTAEYAGGTFHDEEGEGEEREEGKPIDTTTTTTPANNHSTTIVTSTSSLQEPIVVVVAAEALDYTMIVPPRSMGEKVRDQILATLDSYPFQIMGAIVMFLVIADGAFFFFLLMGWQTLCRPRTDCDPRNWWYNFSVQLLNVLFTYMVTVSLPWRMTNLLHTTGCSCPFRTNDIGYDLYGQPTRDIWFYITLFRRKLILLCLILNVLTQYANQATRIVYYNFELQDTSPGNIWTNVFFVSSFAFAAIGGGWIAYEMSHVRKQYPTDYFPPGPIETLQTFIVTKGIDRYLPHCCLRCCGIHQQKPTDHDDEENNSNRNSNDPSSLRNSNNNNNNSSYLAPLPTTTTATTHQYVDPTRASQRKSFIAGTDRNAMRLFGM